MKRVPGWVAIAVLVLGAGWMLRSLFPRTIQVVTPPRIRTVYDTVRTLDTAWVRELVRETEWDTVYLERVTLTAPETVRVYLAPLVGLTALAVPATVGDSTVAQGFLATQDSTGLILRGWRTQWWTAGPLAALSLDTFPPRAAFHPPPAPTGSRCGFWCAAPKYGLGLLIGRASCSVP